MRLRRFLLMVCIINLCIILNLPATVDAKWRMENSNSQHKASAVASAIQETVSGKTIQIEITDEIRELARSLYYDPNLIFNYVYNHIDYVPYLGSFKGPTLTYLDGSGNDMDQASLLIALLRASIGQGKSSISNVVFEYGHIKIDGLEPEIAKWVGAMDKGNNPVTDRKVLDKIIGMIEVYKIKGVQMPGQDLKKGAIKNRCSVCLLRPQLTAKVVFLTRHSRNMNILVEKSISVTAWDIIETYF